LLEVYTGENIAHPAGHMQDILESDIVAISALLLSSNGEYDCSNAKYRHSTLVCKGKDVGFVSGTGFEVREICGEILHSRLRRKPSCSRLDGVGGISVGL
jgi:hypothetical protein